QWGGNPVARFGVVPRKCASPLGARPVAPGAALVRADVATARGIWATGPIRSERLTSAYYVSLGIFLLAAVTMANPRAAAGRIADALLASLSPQTNNSSTSRVP